MNVIPNNICEGLGETSIEERIGPWIQEATLWFEANISSESVLELNLMSPEMEKKCVEMGFETWSERLRKLADTIIQCRALWCAAPALDVTMHPNGLAVVNTDSLAPASAERSREFRKSMMDLMINSIANMLDMLLLIDEWRVSRPAKEIWLATTFNYPGEIFGAVGGDSDWDSLMEAIRQIRDIEDADAMEVWAPEMLEVIRSTKFGSRLTHRSSGDATLDALKGLVKASVRLSLRENETRGDGFLQAEYFYKKRNLQEDYVNLCKSGIDVCKPWADSRTALLYSPVVFRNEKGSSGYFF